MPRKADESLYEEIATRFNISREQAEGITGLVMKHFNVERPLIFVDEKGDEHYPSGKEILDTVRNLVK